MSVFNVRPFGIGQEPKTASDVKILTAQFCGLLSPKMGSVECDDLGR